MKNLKSLNLSAHTELTNVIKSEDLGVHIPPRARRGGSTYWLAFYRRGLASNQQWETGAQRKQLLSAFNAWFPIKQIHAGINFSYNRSTE